MLQPAQPRRPPADRREDRARTRAARNDVRRVGVRASALAGNRPSGACTRARGRRSTRNEPDQRLGEGRGGVLHARRRARRSRSPRSRPSPPAPAASSRRAQAGREQRQQRPARRARRPRRTRSARSPRRSSAGHVRRRQPSDGQRRRRSAEHASGAARPMRTHSAASTTIGTRMAAPALVRRRGRGAARLAQEDDAERLGEAGRGQAADQRQRAMTTTTPARPRAGAGRRRSARRRRGRSGTR